jgi:hypothetical protein
MIARIFSFESVGGDAKQVRFKQSPHFPGTLLTIYLIMEVKGNSIIQFF